MTRILFIVVTVVLLGGAVLAALGFVLVAPLDGHGLHIIVNDRELDLGAHGAGHLAAGALGLLVAASVVGIVVPLALLFGLMLPLLLVLGLVTVAGAALLGVGALALAPIWLPLLLLAWLWRRSRRVRPAPGATIDA
jgi:hypothetical protein